jgi:hypothetical protein
VLHWRQFSIVGLEFTDELAPLLLRLPLLERLQANLRRCTRFDFLPALPRLTHLELHLWDMSKNAWEALHAVFTSGGLARLQALALHDDRCGSYKLLQMLSHTPSLTSLTLGVLRAVRSLSFFHQLPKLAETLVHLTIECEFTWCLPLAEFNALLVLQQLRELRIFHWPSGHAEADGLIALERAPFSQPPRALFPHLEIFEWTPSLPPATRTSF